jgi:hypothetical protein
MPGPLMVARCTLGIGVRKPPSEETAGGVEGPGADAMDFGVGGCRVALEVAGSR